MTAGCCLCIAAVSYNLVLSLRRMIEGGMLSYAYYITLEAGWELFHVGILICVILSFHRGWCKFTGSFFCRRLFLSAGSFHSLVYACMGTPCAFGKKTVIFSAGRMFCFLYCVGMLLFFSAEILPDIIGGGNLLVLKLRVQ